MLLKTESIEFIDAFHIIIKTFLIKQLIVFIIIPLEFHRAFFIQVLFPEPTIFFLTFFYI